MEKCLVRNPHTFSLFLQEVESFRKTLTMLKDDSIIHQLLLQTKLIMKTISLYHSVTLGVGN